MRTSHKKLKHLKRKVKRDAVNKDVVSASYKLLLSNEEARTKDAQRVCFEWHDKYYAGKRLHEKTEQHLQSCEAANIEKEHVIRYLEQRVTELIMNEGGD